MRPDSPVAAREARAFIEECLAQEDVTGRRVIILVPDKTRTAPLAAIFPAIHRVLSPMAASLDVVVALGTHEPMPLDDIKGMLGYSPAEWDAACSAVTLHNHEWWKAETFTDLGSLAAGDVARMSAGLLDEEIPVRVNHLVASADLVLILGPVLPHEVVGFSGGNKYLFPGVSGPEMVHATHWLGALLTSYCLIGSPGTTPVRQLIDAAAALLPVRRLCVALVTGNEGETLHAVAVGTPEDAWAAASQVSADVHVRWLDAPYERVLALVPPMYPDMWTAAKGMYKLEPVVADGGELIIYGTHVREFSRVHGDVLAAVGYHCRDFFLANWDRYRKFPRGVLAHSTHLFGQGTYDSVHGERARISVRLATGIPDDLVRAHGLTALDPASIDVDRMAADPRTLVVPRAGEMLYRLRSQRAALTGAACPEVC
jgi:nickel-dependent lactate racemase